MNMLTNLLKASIAYEQGKALNLLTHKREDLSLMIEVIESERMTLEHRISSTQLIIDNAEDIEEGLEVNLRNTIAKLKERLESLLAWRALFLAAWKEVKK